MVVELYGQIKTAYHNYNNKRKLLKFWIKCKDLFMSQCVIILMDSEHKQTTFWFELKPAQNLWAMDWGPYGASN